MKRSHSYKTIGRMLAVTAVGYCLYSNPALAIDRSNSTFETKALHKTLHKKPLHHKIKVKKVIQPKVVDEKELTCLAKNIFFEARGTDKNEEIKIINVTTNRVKSKMFPKTYCGVVYDHKQFSWTINLVKHDISRLIKKVVEYKAWENAQKMARFELEYGYKDTTFGSLLYHTPGVNPKWCRNGKTKMVMATNYHMYYKFKRQ